MEAFNRELECLVPRLRQYAAALTRDAVETDELVQSCVAQALEKRAYWRPGSDLRAWLFTMMHNLFISHARRSRRAPVVAVGNIGEWQVGISGRQEDRLVLRDLQEAVARLPADYQRVLLLVGLHDMSYEETAKTLRIPVGTVKSRLSRSREMVRLYIESGAVAPQMLREAA
jgi:RNA polymerase sigma-70 factor (ECF subfamily)